MRIYNTRTGKKEVFKPLVEGKVTMYVCGPTVYDYIHIGNARPFIVFDAARRYMEYKGLDVNYVQNFTDVDDKIIQKANLEQTDVSVIAERFIAEALKDSEGLGVKAPTSAPRATNEIEGMIQMIQTLLQKGHAYEAEGTVYFDTRSFAGYGKLSGKNLDDLEAGARVAVSESKRGAFDFVLWKPAKEGEPFWPSPWGDGRPGWHIECSVMAKKYLGDTIDIHAGGEDLIFPHHENETAQSEAANGVPFARYWLHNGFINIDNQKMSKSKGNFFTIREIAAEIPYDTIRFFILSAHYRSPINFSKSLLESAGQGLARIREAVSRMDFLLQSTLRKDLDEREQSLHRESKAFGQAFEESMDNDFNTAGAIAAIFDFVKFANIHAHEGSSEPFIQGLKDGLLALCDCLGIRAAAPAGETHAEASFAASEIERLIAERAAAKKEKNFQKADDIRAFLLGKGVVLQDTPAGTRYTI